MMHEDKSRVPVQAPPAGGSPQNPDPEVTPVAKRRKFSPAYRNRILEEIDRAGAGEIGLILRREGLYSSQLAGWRKGRLKMSPGKQKKESSDVNAENRCLEKEVAKLKLKLLKAEAMLDLQKKAADMISLMTLRPDDKSEAAS